ncbi:MAG: DUF4410 domain-containing protein [Planctomycetes bacterium]|nr:DUF4410 domain-containing protein [Planctomycetota bacterium]
MRTRAGARSHVFRWIGPALAVAGLAGCASSSKVRTETPLTSRVPQQSAVSCEVVSPLAAASEVVPRLEGEIVARLRERNLFGRVARASDRDGPPSDVRLRATIVAVRAINGFERLWFGIWAGRARLELKVEIWDLAAGRLLGVFASESRSSNFPYLGGTTDQVIKLAADGIVQHLEQEVRTGRVAGPSEGTDGKGEKERVVASDVD